MFFYCSQQLNNINDNMEDLLQQIIKEATGNKFAHLRNAAQNAHGKLEDFKTRKKKKYINRYLNKNNRSDKLQRQHGIHRDPSYELRSVCLTAMQMALDTRRPKFVTLALNGTHVSILGYTYNII